MKILLISPTFNGIGGIAQHVRDFVVFLKKHGHEVDVLSSENTPIIPIKKLKNPSFLVTSYLKTKFMKNYDIVILALSSPDVDSLISSCHNCLGCALPNIDTC